MHQEAEYGIAAHWSYNAYKGEAPKNRSQLAWVQQIAKWQEEVASNQEFMEALKIDTFEHRIFVFTPKGQVKDLPVGAKPLDFAYQVHSEVGNHCYGARINGKLSHLSTELKNGDVVDILTNPKSMPKQDWLDLVVTSSAKAHIRRALREQQPDEDLEPVTEVVVEPVAPTQIKSKTPIKVVVPEVLVEGRRGYLVHLAQCCHPQVGDSIIGLVALDKGISVHQRWCKNVLNIGDPTKLVRVSWRGSEAKQRTNIRMEAYDKRGLARELASIVTDAGWNIIGVRGDTLEEEGTVSYSMLIEVDASEDLTSVINQLKDHPNIYLVERQ